MGMKFTPEQQRVIELHNSNILVSAAAGRVRETLSNPSTKSLRPARISFIFSTAAKAATRSFSRVLSVATRERDRIVTGREQTGLTNCVTPAAQDTSPVLTSTRGVSRFSLHGVVTEASVVLRFFRASAAVDLPVSRPCQ